MFRLASLPLAVFCVLAAVAAHVLAADAAKSLPGNARTYENTVNKAIEYFRTKGQAADGSYSAEAGPGVTAVVTAAILRSGRTPEDPLVAKSLKYLEGFVRPDGGIYAEKSLYQNYETCIAMQCFVEANKGKRYDTLLKNAERFVKHLQWVGEKTHDEEKADKSHTWYGGAGYGGSQRPDLSNTAFLIETLKSVGRGADDEAIQRALVFVSRCQNLETEHNTTAFAAKFPASSPEHGGFYYTPAAGGSSQAGTTPDGGLRSYASMTYAGLKSMIYAGVGPDDARVKAALKWLRQHYALEENPGMGSAGLYYYYHTFAKALGTMGVDQFEDANGKKHDWRADLVSELAKRQKPDGSWVNENARWLEGNSNLVSGYALLALTYSRPKT